MTTIETQVYSREGKAKGTVKLPEAIFATPWNGDLVHQVLMAMRSNANRSTAHTKFRSEVSGGGKKPWKQKGTGQARHGSRRSPIWIGGGVSHGPRTEKDFEKKINKKVRHKALFIALSQKLRDNQMIMVERFGFDAIKTADANALVKALSTIKGFETIGTPNPVNMLFVLPTVDETIEKSFRNLACGDVIDVHQLNPADVMQYRYIVMMSPEDCTAFLESKVAPAKKVTA